MNHEIWEGFKVIAVLSLFLIVWIFSGVASDEITKAAQTKNYSRVYFLVLACLLSLILVSFAK